MLLARAVRLAGASRSASAGGYRNNTMGCAGVKPVTHPISLNCVRQGLQVWSPNKTLAFIALRATSILISLPMFLLFLAIQP